MRVPPDQSGHDIGHCVDSFLKPPKTDLPCHAGKPSREEKHFESPVAMGQAVSEMKKHARVALHRAADIA